MHTSEEVLVKVATRVLFADDQLPDDDIPDPDVLATISNRYPNAQPGFVAAFLKLRGIVSSLRDRGYQVTVANSYAKAMHFARNDQFDIAIIDLGWFGDESMDESERRNAGWDIANQLDESDRVRSGQRPTARIIYSSRFSSNPSIGDEACKRGILPFFKVYSERDSFPIPPLGASSDTLKRSANRDEANKNSLAAAVGFIEHLIRARTAEMNEALDILHESRVSLKRWEIVTISSMALSVALIALSLVAVAFFNKPVAIITAITGAVTAIVPKLLADQLKANRADISKGIERVVELGSH